MSLEHFKNTFVFLISFELEPASSQCGCRGIAQSTNVLLGFLSKINQILLKNAQYSIHSTVNFFDAFLVERFRDYPGDTGVNDGSRPARLSDQAISN